MRPIDHINALPIHDVMSWLGIAYNGKPRIKCFFHNSKDEDLYINKDKNFFYCFASKCGKSGGNFQLVQNYLNIQKYSDVYKWFEKHCPNIKSGIVPVRTLIHIVINNEVREYRDFSEIYNFVLNESPTITIYNYLIKMRFLDFETVKKNNIKGVDPKGYLFYKLIKRFDFIDLLDSGVISISKKTGNPYYTFFSDPYICPLYQHGKIVSLQSRPIPNEKYPNQPKYRLCLNRPKPQIYVPKQLDFGFYYLCEGVITALSYNTKKQPAIALMSGTFNESILEELEPYKNARFILSPDMNGQQVMDDLRVLLVRNGFNLEKEDHKYIEQAYDTGATEKDLHDINFNDFNDVLKLENKL